MRGKKKSKKTVRKTDKVSDKKDTYVVNVGQYGHQASAQREASEYMLPSIFAYRSAVFLPPNRYGITVKILKATPVELKNPETPVYTWTVAVELQAIGPKDSVLRWIMDFSKAAKYYTP